MAAQGWMRLVAEAKSVRGNGKYRIPAYSEFMPAPRLLCKPYGEIVATTFAEDDPWGWPISEYEEAFELRPGLEHLAREILDSLYKLGEGQSTHGISRKKLENNPYWPAELADSAGTLKHERYLVILPLALSRTQDDHGRVRWTLIGGSEQGPARTFWNSFFSQPNRELPEESGLDFFRRILTATNCEPEERVRDLLKCGFRIWPSSGVRMPSWTGPYLWPGKSLGAVRYLLTFEPFAKLPRAARQSYLQGQLHIFPFPGSLLFWGIDGYRQLSRDLPLALQIPLLHAVARRESPGGLRVLQSGWMHEPRTGEETIEHGPVRNTYIRTHRWARTARHEDPLSAMVAREDKLAHVLFSTAPDDLELYGKPMARNVQIWTEGFRLLLDGPRATKANIEQTIEAMATGGLFGYRFLFPAMRVGGHEIYWHRPLVAYLEGNQPAVLHGGPLGYLTAYRTNGLDLSNAVELWPRILDRPAHRAAIRFSQQVEHPRHHADTLRARKILEAAELARARLPFSFARNLVASDMHEKLEPWMESLSPEFLPKALSKVIAKQSPFTGETLTFHRTSRRSFEVDYWRTIAELSATRFINKENADCVRDPITQSRLRHHHRDLEALGDYLLARYQKAAAAIQPNGVMIGSIPFCWQTDFSFDWSGGWLRNQKGETNERDLIVMIPGRDRSRAVIMADHYDTAYMEDVYGNGPRKGARIASAGADDNHSATAALIHAFPVFCELSRAGKLGCDIWLVHLTGEEFPSDCLGARHLCERLVEKNLRMRLASGKWRDLSRVRIQGVYVLDMVAHNNSRAPDVFQISPGEGPTALWLAYQAHLANELWNSCRRKWNRSSSRTGRGRSQRSSDAGTVPSIAEHPELCGQIRLPWEPGSTLFNTDGQIFSDAGIPVVLFMENYDINRIGYHDTHDTMENIDLDYGSALAAIAIEAVARAASQTPMRWGIPRLCRGGSKSSTTAGVIG
ncbi:MAG TPA: M28 family peptidase [Acidobacteriota bacterium]|nr:M28 family peptidase [Acidobacteriota bacterium]